METNADGDKQMRQSRSLPVKYGEAVDSAIKKAICEALLKHKQAKNSVAVWRENEIVLLKPEEILADENSSDEICNNDSDEIYAELLEK